MGKKKKGSQRAVEQERLKLTATLLRLYRLGIRENTQPSNKSKNNIVSLDTVLGTGVSLLRGEAQTPGSLQSGKEKTESGSYQGTEISKG